jgi:hypothetical protein
VQTNKIQNNDKAPNLRHHFDIPFKPIWSATGKSGDISHLKDMLRGKFLRGEKTPHMECEMLSRW